MGREKGLRPHTHHIEPRSLGGDDEERNLITLCQPCHTARLGHRFMLDRIPDQDLPQYVKYSLREIGLNLLAYAEHLNPRNFPSAEYLIKDIEGIRDSLRRVADLAETCR